MYPLLPTYRTKVCMTLCVQRISHQKAPLFFSRIIFLLPPDEQTHSAEEGQTTFFCLSLSRMRDKRFPRESANGTWPWKEKRIFYISRPRGQRKRIVSRRRLFHRVNYPTQDESDWMESLHLYIRIFLKALYAPNICPPFFPSLPDNKLMTSNICLVSRGLLFFRGWMTNSSAYRHTHAKETRERDGERGWKKKYIK